MCAIMLKFRIRDALYRYGDDELEGTDLFVLEPPFAVGGVAFCCFCSDVEKRRKLLFELAGRMPYPALPVPGILPGVLLTATGDRNPSTTARMPVEARNATSGNKEDDRSHHLLTRQSPSSTVLTRKEGDDDDEIAATLRTILSEVCTILQSIDEFCVLVVYLHWQRVTFFLLLAND